MVSAFRGVSLLKDSRVLFYICTLRQWCYRELFLRIQPDPLAVDTYPPAIRCRGFRLLNSG